MKQSLLRAWLTAALMIAVGSASAFAQGGTTAPSIIGTVSDASGAVIPVRLWRYEESRSPDQNTANRTIFILAPNQGVFRYDVGQVRESICSNRPRDLDAQF